MRETVGNPLQLGLGGDFSPFTVIPRLNSSPKALSEKGFWREFPPTNKQIRSIALMCIALGIKEPLEETVANRMEARNLQYDLKGKLNFLNAERKLKRGLKKSK